MATCETLGFSRVSKLVANIAYGENICASRGSSCDLKEMRTDKRVVYEVEKCYTISDRNLVSFHAHALAWN